MALEKERKFLCTDPEEVNAFIDKVNPQDTHHIRQGYVHSSPKVSTRIRITDNKEAVVTIKYSTDNHEIRHEYDATMSNMEEASDLYYLTEFKLSKIRFKYEYKGRVFEVDVFDGKNKGLVLMEIESEDCDTLTVDDLPLKHVKEVTSDPFLLNSNLAEFPFSKWGERLVSIYYGD